MIFGAMRAARIAAGLSMQQLASRASVSASTVSRVETGNIIPTPATLARLLKALQVDWTTAKRITRKAKTLRTARRIFRLGR